jgi:hypothetical protein
MKSSGRCLLFACTAHQAQVGLQELRAVEGPVEALFTGAHAATMGLPSSSASSCSTRRRRALRAT